MAELSKKEEVEITVRNMTGLTSLRRVANTQSFEWLERLSEQLIALVDERASVEKARIAELEKKEAVRQKALAYLRELELTVEDLAQPFTGRESRPKNSHRADPARAKYRYIDEKGKAHTWSGTGRMSKMFKKLHEEGRDFEEFLIEKTGEVRDAEGIIADNITAQS